MKELIRYLIDNMYLDFQGDISLESVRGFLREDESREARQLLSKIIEEKGIDDLLINEGDLPELKDDEVRIAVRAFSLNFGDIFNGAFIHLGAERDGLLQLLELAHDADQANGGLGGPGVRRFELALLNGGGRGRGGFP